MNLKQFYDKWNNKGIDFDSYAGYQCVDEIRMYMKEVLNFPHTGGVEGAKDLFLNYEKMPLEVEHFHKIDYAGFPAEVGDIIVWGATPSNKYGHVAIVLFASNDYVVIMEQNGFTQKGVETVSRTYENCLGFLRPRLNKGE